MSEVYTENFDFDAKIEMMLGTDSDDSDFEDSE